MGIEHFDVLIVGAGLSAASVAGGHCERNACPVHDFQARRGGPQRGPLQGSEDAQCEALGPGAVPRLG